MSTETPELLVARSMRDHAKMLRSVAENASVAKVALQEEERFTTKVRELEAKEEQPELAGIHSHAA
jgi:hypothetical protein